MKFHHFWPDSGKIFSATPGKNPPDAHVTWQQRPRHPIYGMIEGARAFTYGALSAGSLRTEYASS